MTALELRPEETAQTERLFAAYSERLVGYCLRRLGSRPEAEDAVQTTFLYAHRALRRGVVPESEEAWLFCIAKNICRWQQRTASRQGPVAGDVDPDALSAIAEVGDASEIQHDLDEALAMVPERQREAILLREWRGLSCPEIAEVLELSPLATHALLARARRTVAGALSAAGRRPVLGLDFGSLLLQLRGLLTGSAAKTAAVAVALAAAGVGGVTVERTLVGSHENHQRAPASAALETRADAPTAARRANLVTREGKATGGRGAPSATRAQLPVGTAPVPGGVGLAPVAGPTTADSLTSSSKASEGDAPADGAGRNHTQPVPNSPTPAPQPLDLLPVDAQPPTVPLPPVPDPELPSVEVSPVTVGEVTTPGVAVPSATVPVSNVTDPVTGLLP